MSTPFSHPEDLFDREREGALSAEEREQLESHLASCAACRLERAARADFEDELSADDVPGLLDRAIDGALERAPSGTSRARPRRTLWLVAAAAAFVAAAAVAAWSERSSDTRAPASVPSPPTSVAEAPPKSPTTAAAEPELPVSPLPAPEPSSQADAEEHTPTAAALFARANQARRNHEDAEAIRLYRALQARYPDSREARASRAMLGQLLLDKKDPGEALGEFDSYLGDGGGTVTEEALAGRAQALQKLGRVAEERAAWQELLKKFPSSVHAARARERLAATQP
jgi:TolA-binding protein